jgi:hypothetical protein
MRTTIALSVVLLAASALAASQSIRLTPSNVKAHDFGITIRTRAEGQTYTGGQTGYLYRITITSAKRNMNKVHGGLEVQKPDGSFLNATLMPFHRSEKELIHEVSFSREYLDGVWIGLDDDDNITTHFYFAIKDFMNTSEPSAGGDKEPAPQP